MARGINVDGGIVACEVPQACAVLSACVPGRRVPCLDVSRAHAAKLKLCDDLEAIADGLPDRIDRRNCLFIAASLPPLLVQSHAYEEKYVFPAFQRNGSNRIARLMTVRRLKVEHVEDECAAQDLADVLSAIGEGGPVRNPEALGFMLRAFFESMRRHIAFEREHIIPVIARGLIDEAYPARRRQDV